MNNTIRYYDHESGWHFAYLVRLGRKWAVVRTIPFKRNKRVLLADLDMREIWRAA